MKHYLIIAVMGHFAFVGGLLTRDHMYFNSHCGVVPVEYGEGTQRDCFMGPSLWEDVPHAAMPMPEDMALTAYIHEHAIPVEPAYPGQTIMVPSNKPFTDAQLHAFGLR